MSWLIMGIMIGVGAVTGLAIVIAEAWYNEKENRWDKDE